MNLRGYGGNRHPNEYIFGIMTHNVASDNIIAVHIGVCT